jgi:hypothetical protein
MSCLFNPIFEFVDTMLLRTVCTTVKDSICFHAVTDDTATAMRARGRQGVNGAFKAVKNMNLAAPVYFKAFVVNVTAHLTALAFVRSHPALSFVHILPLSCCLFRALRLFSILFSGASLGSRRLGSLRDVPPWLGFETIPADLNRSGAQFPDQVFSILGVTDQLPILHVSISLAHQPLDRRPPTAGALPSHPLEMTFITDVLSAKRREIASITQLDMIVISLPAATRLSTSTAFGLCASTALIFSTHCHPGLLKSILPSSNKSKPLRSV